MSDRLLPGFPAGNRSAGYAKLLCQLFLCQALFFSEALQKPAELNQIHTCPKLLSGTILAQTALKKQDIP